MTEKSPFRRTAAALMTAGALLVHTANGYSAPRSVSAAASAAQLIMQHSAMGETNPSHAEEAKHLNALFQDAFIRRNNLLASEKEKIYCESIGHYATSVCHKFELEDTIDGYRALMHGVLALATSALTSTPQEALPYFELAKVILQESTLAPEYGTEKHYAALLLLETLYRSEHNLLDSDKKKLLLQGLSKCNTLPAQEKKSFIEAMQALK